MSKRTQMVVFIGVIIVAGVFLQVAVPHTAAPQASPVPASAPSSLVQSESLRVASLDAGRDLSANDALTRQASTVLDELNRHCTEPLPTLVNSAVAATATLKQAGFTRGPVQILEDTMVALPAYVTRVSCAHWIPDDVALTEQGG